MNELMRALGLQYYVDEVWVACQKECLFRLLDPSTGQYSHHYTGMSDIQWQYKTEFGQQLDAYKAKQYGGISFPQAQSLSNAAGMITHYSGLGSNLPRNNTIMSGIALQAQAQQNPTVASQLQSTQAEINKLLSQIQQSQTQIAAPRIFVPMDDKRSLLEKLKDWFRG